MENLSFINLSSSKASDNEEIFLGLKKISQKEINSKYFYNEIGSKLFDQISKLEEYYPTRKEIEIFNFIIDLITQVFLSFKLSIECVC